jgi:hypothetical protein
VSATVVLANSTKVVVNDALAAGNPALADLWFALKGAGGGNFGVVVSMTIKLHRVSGALWSLLSLSALSRSLSLSRITYLVPPTFVFASRHSSPLMAPLAM